MTAVATVFILSIENITKVMLKGYNITILVNYSIIIDINKCSCYNGNDGKLGLLYHFNFGYWDYK